MRTPGVKVIWGAALGLAGCASFEPDLEPVAEGVGSVQVSPSRTQVSVDADDRVCFLTGIEGGYEGPDEMVTLELDAGLWQLSMKGYVRSSARAQMTCALRERFVAPPEVELRVGQRWVQQGDDRVTGTVAAISQVRGGEDWAHWLEPDDLESHFSQKAGEYRGLVTAMRWEGPRETAQAAFAPDGMGVMAWTFRAEEGQRRSEPLVSVEAGLCYIMGLSGALRAPGDQVELVVEEGRWRLNLTRVEWSLEQGREALEVSVRCVAWDQRSGP